MTGAFLAALERLRAALEPYGVKAAQRPRSAEGVDKYEQELRRIYEDWSDDLAAQVADADEDERDELINTALVTLLLSLRRSGRDGLEQAVRAIADTEEWSDEVQGILDEAIVSNEQFLETSLIPALRDRLRAALNDDDIIAALEAGEGEAALSGNLDAMDSRVASYAGAWWILYHDIFGIMAREHGAGVIAYLDPLAQHCTECPIYQSVAGEEYASMDDYLSATGDRVPGEFECDGNCRCWLVEA